MTTETNEVLRPCGICGKRVKYWNKKFIVVARNKEKPAHYRCIENQKKIEKSLKSFSWDDKRVSGAV